ncbi:MAG: transposase [Proteobacteria bacterium]|nr:transposase [Pseudomonadota bacterium]
MTLTRNPNVHFHVLFVDGVHLADGTDQSVFRRVAGPPDDLLGHSITYRIAVGARAGQKTFTLQTVPARPPEWLDAANGAARAGGFSLHAGVDIASNQRPKLERRCRHVSRPPVASERMALTASGHVRYQLTIGIP